MILNTKIVILNTKIVILNHTMGLALQLETGQFYTDIKDSSIENDDFSLDK